MKTLLALLLLVSNITFSQLMHCGMPAQAETDYLKFPEAHLSEPKRQPKMVNGMSFVAAPLNRNANNAERYEKLLKLHPKNENTPYAEFFKKTYKLKAKPESSEDHAINKLARKVMDMMSKLTAHNQFFGHWLYQTSAKDCFQLAHNAFSSGCDEEQRLWATGILAAILDHMTTPPNEPSAQEAFQNLEWSEQVKNDIKAAQDEEHRKQEEFEEARIKEAASLKDATISQAQINSESAPGHQPVS